MKPLEILTSSFRCLEESQFQPRCEDNCIHRAAPLLRFAALMRLALSTGACSGSPRPCQRVCFGCIRVSHKLLTGAHVEEYFVGECIFYQSRQRSDIYSSDRLDPHKLSPLLWVFCGSAKSPVEGLNSAWRALKGWGKVFRRSSA